MSKNKAAPLVLTHFGEPHSGKTFEMERFIEKINPETVFVYKRGWENDWKEYEEIRLFAEKNRLYFEYKKKDYDFANCFMKLFKGKRVKSPRCMDLQMKGEKLLFYLLCQGGYEGLFLHLEDAKAYIHSNMSPIVTAFFYETKNIGIRVGMIHHNPNEFPKKLWGALTHAKVFQNGATVDTTKMGGFQHANTVKGVSEKVNQLPKYSYGLIDFRKGIVNYKKGKKK